MDQWRSQQLYRILCEVCAKLIGVVIQHWLLLTAGWDDPHRSLVKASAAVRDAAFTLALTMRLLRRLTQTLRALALPLQTGCRKNIRRAAPGTYQLLEHPDLTYDLPSTA